MEQGNVFRRGIAEGYVQPIGVSIPLEQGNVFRLKTEEREFLIGLRLNPFGTGQCLSTAVGC